MAIIKPLSQNIVKGFKNTLVFYKMKGQHIVRTWPRKRPGPGTPAQEFCKDVKRGCHKTAKKISPSVRDALIQNTSGSGFTWLDFWMSMCMKAYYLAGKLPIYLLDFNYWFESPTLHIEYTLSEEGPHRITRHRINRQFPARQRTITSHLAGCEIPIEVIPDCEDDVPTIWEEIAEIPMIQNGVQTRRKGTGASAVSFNAAWLNTWNAFLAAEWEETTWGHFVNWGRASYYDDINTWIGEIEITRFPIKFNFGAVMSEEEFDEIGLARIKMEGTPPGNYTQGGEVYTDWDPEDMIQQETTTIIELPKESLSYPITEVVLYAKTPETPDELKPTQPDGEDPHYRGLWFTQGNITEIAYVAGEYPHIEVPEFCIYVLGNYIRVMKLGDGPEIISPYFLIK